MPGTPGDRLVPVLADLGEAGAGDDKEGKGTQDGEGATPDPLRRRYRVAGQTGASEALAHPRPGNRPAEAHRWRPSLQVVLDQGAELVAVAGPPCRGVPPEHRRAPRVSPHLQFTGPHAWLPAILGTRRGAVTWFATASRRAPSSAKRCMLPTASAR